MKTEYNCWKCPEWHESRFTLEAISYCTQRITIGKLAITIPRMSWLDKFWWQQTYRSWKYRLGHSQCTECRKWFPKNQMWKVNNQENWCQECM